MKKTLISALLATVAMPLAAFAQTDSAPTPTEAPAQTQEPAAGAETAPDDGAADTGTTTTTTEPAPAEDDASTTAEDPAATTEDDAATTTEDPAATTDDDAATTTEDPAATTGDDAATTAEDPAATTGDDAATTTAEDPAAEDDAAGQLAGEDDVEGPFVTVPMTGAWRVSNLEGKSVEDANGESIGDISDVLVNEKGEVIAVLVGVGGFLGIGEKNVAVSMSALEFGPGKTEGLPTEEEVQAEAEMEAQTAPATPAAPATGTDMTAAPAAPAAPEPPVVGQDNLPDRIVLNVTREELEAAPAYEDVEEGTADAAGGAVAPATDAPAD